MRSRLGLRSAYSFLYGTRMPADIAGRAASFGAKSLAISDRDGLYGVHAVIEATREAGLKPIVAVEFTAAAGPTKAAGSVFAFAKNRGGFSRLCEILSARKKAAPGDFDLIAALRSDSAGLALASRSSEILAGLALRVPELYTAISPRSLAAIPASRALGLPLIALDDASFLDSEDYAVHKTLRAIALGKTVGNLPDPDEGEVESPDAIFLPSAGFERALAGWPEALSSAEALAESCEFAATGEGDSIFQGFIFPDYATGDMPAAKGAASILRERVVAGAEERYGELSDAAMGRIEYELDIIERKGFAPYFLVMDDIVAMASRTCGRGSGAASIVSYALSITNVDPIAHDLYFERFLNMSRPDPPDIDVDFAWDERGDLIKRVIERFGADRCARVANHNFFRPRSALRESAKAYGLADAEISRMERDLFEYRDGREELDPLWAEILSVARRIEGLPRGLSMHCGGLVIAPGPIDRYAPIEFSREGFPLLAWEKEGTESAGLVKLDLLGNRSLAVIRDALANLEGEGILIDKKLWNPEEDEATVAALARGDSMGVFYIESPAMRQLQKKTGKGDFAHIVIHSSIIRPAANKFISEYVRRLKGGEWKPLHPLLVKILDESYGILCYQEDVSKAAVALAGFNEADADKLRKVIAKKAGAKKLAEYETQFFSGCQTRGVRDETIKEVWAMMLSFDGYSFCKPHSASYAMVSFQSAYLRVHFPAAFMAAVLSNQGGFYRPQAYISETRRMGLRIIGPDANLSRYRYYGIDLNKANGDRGTLVVGLMSIAKLSKSGADSLIAERERGGSFAGLGDLGKRIELCRDDIVALVASGVFDSIAKGKSRAFQARELLGAAQKKSSRGSQGELFAGREPGPQIVGNTRHERMQELANEYASLGFLRELHPLALWAQELAGLRVTPAIELARQVGERVQLLGWPITQKEVFTKDELVMDFVSFEDETALYETVLFPEVYSAHRNLLFDRRPLLLMGIVKDDQGAICVEVSSIRAAC